jgi:DNA-binding beta-propeller fold protein YncE
VFIISDCVGFVHRLDPLTGRILATLSTHGESRSLTMPPAGNLIYATNRRRDTLLTIRKQDLVVLAEHPLDCAARAITFAPSGNHYCVVTTEDTISVRRTADHSLVRQLGETSTLPVVFSHDGLRAWVTNDSELVELGFPSRGGD